MSIAEIVRNCLAGKESAIRELVQQYQGMVFGLCYRMMGQREDAEDAAQETFVRAIRALRNFDTDRPFEPWLLAIAANRCRTAMAARSRRPCPTELCDAVADPRPDPDAARTLSEELQLALQGLRAEHRQAFVMFHELGRSYVEIAESLDCPVGTVKTWVHRARQDLIVQLRSRHVLQSSGAVA
jgi:RNA polymerase sigma-70 factor, ECF subfamily